jgi:hypothetical protein
MAATSSADKPTRFAPPTAFTAPRGARGSASASSREGKGDTAPPSTPSPTESAALRPSKDGGFGAARLRGALDAQHVARARHADAHDMRVDVRGRSVEEKMLTSFS